MRNICVLVIFQTWVWSLGPEINLGVRMLYQTQMLAMRSEALRKSGKRGSTRSLRIVWKGRINPEEEKGRWKVKEAVSNQTKGAPNAKTEGMNDLSKKLYLVWQKKAFPNTILVSFSRAGGNKNWYLGHYMSGHMMVTSYHYHHHRRLLTDCVNQEGKVRSRKLLYACCNCPTPQNC